MSATQENRDRQIERLIEILDRIAYALEEGNQMAREQAKRDEAAKAARADKSRASRSKADAK